MYLDLLYSGLDVVAVRMASHARDIDYVILDEVISRKKRLPVARVGFAPLDLAAYMDDDAPDGLAHALDDEDITDDPTEEGADERPERPQGLPLHQAARALNAGCGELPEDTLALCHAVLRWIQAEIQRIMVHRPLCTFQLRFYRPKGGYVESKNFKAENPAYEPPRADDDPEDTADDETPPAEAPPSPQDPAPPAEVIPPPAPQLPAPLPALTAPAPPVFPPAPPPPRPTPAVAIGLGVDEPRLIFLDPETIPEARVWRALGQATEQLLARAGAAYGNIIDLQSRTVLHQAAQLDKSQALVEHLASQLLSARQVKETDEAEQKVDERQLRVREELGKTFLNELGSLGRMLAGGHFGMPPELVEIGDLITTSPELADALRDPQVRALLKDETTRKELAQLLRVASKKPSGPQAA